jgi:hypothetical protein
MFNSRSIGKEEFVIIVAFTCKKDPWIRNLSGLSIEPYCDFKKIYKSYVPNAMDREATNQIKKNRRKEK